MDHKEAIRLQAVDRYLLGELSDIDRHGFEEHFFSCSECSEDLRIGAILVDNSRAVLREEFFDAAPAGPAADPPRPGWFLWWRQVPLGAAIALLALVGYQNLVVLPEYRRQVADTATAAVPPRFTLRPAVRGSVPVIAVPKGARFVEIRAEEVEPAAGGYDCTIQNDRGGVVARLHAPPVEAGEKLTVLLDARQTAPGQYSLVVRRSSDRVEIGQYPFTLQID